MQAQPKDYAAAIYDLAFEAWTMQLGGVQQAIQQDQSLHAALQDPERSTSAKLALLGDAVPDGIMAPVRKFLGTLLEAGQLDDLDAILSEFAKMVERRPERHIAHVTSAVPLTSEETLALQAKLRDRFGLELEFQFEVDPSLVGGVLLRVGDQVIDGTVAGKLTALRNTLM